MHEELTMEVIDDALDESAEVVLPSGRRDVERETRTAPPPAGNLARRTLAIVLAGGRGARLGPLTAWRAKPSVPFGGKFRIIDFTLSNCVNSGIRRIGICTQYKAQSLIRHVQRGWSFLDGRFGEFVELLPAQQRVADAWYSGTADAVFQNIDIARRHEPDFVLVTAGDHIYKMDYARMLAEHVARGADATVAAVEVPLDDARAFGVMQVDAASHLVHFDEKPPRPTPLPWSPGMALASMGIYVFNAAFLYEQLIRDADAVDSSHDFGKDLLPWLVAHRACIHAHNFHDSCVGMTGTRPYWRDVGTIDAYWESNIELTHVVPPLNLYDRDWPIWTYQEQLPPAKFVFDDDGRRGGAFDSLVSGGVIVSGSTVRRSVLFNGVHVADGGLIEDSVLLPNVRVGTGVRLRRAVVDKHCRLPDGLIAGFDPVADRARFQVTEKGVALITPEMLGQRPHHVR
jgi:glucose-1-phosphate adenylyltransferase